MSHTREELINRIGIFRGESICVNEDIADFILLREKQILDEVEKPLKRPFKLNKEMYGKISDALEAINRLREDK